MDGTVLPPHPLKRLVPGLGEIRCGGVFANNGDPAGLGGLPGTLILPAHVSAVDQLIAIDRIAVDNDTQGGTGNALEAHRRLAEVKVDVGDNLSRLHGNGVHGKRVVVGGQQIGRQHLIGGLVVGFVENAVVEPGTVGASGQCGGPSHIIRDFIVPVEILQGHVGCVCHRQIIPHGLAGQHFGVAPLGDGDAQIGGFIVGADFDNLAGVLQRDVMDGGIYLPVGRGCDFNHLIARYAAVALGHEELDIRNGRVIGAGYLLDQQRTHGTVAEKHPDRLLLLSGQVDSLGRGVDDVRAVRGEFFDDVGARFAVGHREGAIDRSAVCPDHRAAGAAGIAAQIADLEDCPLNGGPRLRIVFPYANSTQRSVEDAEGMALAGGDEGFLFAGLRHGEPFRGLQLLDAEPAVPEG